MRMDLGMRNTLLYDFMHCMTAVSLEMSDEPFFIMVKTESTSKDLFDCSVNCFFVKGQESIYYTYNNGKLATDPKLACENFLGALGRIPKVIESHEKEKEKVVANKEIYTAIANYCCPIKPLYTAISSLNPAEIGMISSYFKFQAPH